MKVFYLSLSLKSHIVMHDNNFHMSIVFRYTLGAFEAVQFAEDSVQGLQWS